MEQDDLSGQNWSDREIDLIVADYFGMLSADLSGQSYVKAHHNDALRQMIGRSRGSIEFKHQNISAVLMRLGLPWIGGYKPMANFQSALIDGIGRYLGRPEQLEKLTPTAREMRADIFAEQTPLWMGPPPNAQGLDDVQTPATLGRLIRKFDPGERDARNRALGKQGEALVLDHERRLLMAADRLDLASKVRWVSEEDGDGAGYDIRSFDLDGAERLIEVKTTLGYNRTPFYLSENERAFSEERPDAFRLVRVYDFARKPAAFELLPPLTDWVALEAISYRAKFAE